MRQYEQKLICLQQQATVNPELISEIELKANKIQSDYNFMKEMKKSWKNLKDLSPIDFNKILKASVYLRNKSFEDDHPLLFGS